nr:MAG TPA: hypothetical protein [Caudoviricetes sp.]
MIHSITSKVWASSGSSFFIVSIALFAVFLISALSKIVVFSAFGAKLLTISITLLLSLLICCPNYWTDDVVSSKK